MRNKLYTSLILFISVSCNYKNDDECIDQNLEIKQISYTQVAVNLIADEHQYSHALTKVKEFGGREYLYALDNKNFIIDRYDLTTKKHDRKISIRRTGPDAVNTIGGLAFDIITPDSIVLLSPYKRLYIINESGHKILERSFEKELEVTQYPVNSLIFAAMGIKNMVSLPIIYSAKHHAVYSTCWWSETFMNTTWLWYEFKYPPLVKIPLDSDKKIQFIGKFPFDLADDSLPISIINHFTLNADDCAIIQFQFSHKIYDTCTDIFTCISGSNTLQAVKRYPKNYNLSDEEELLDFNTEARNAGLLYDKYRKVYYSIYLHQQAEKDVNGLLNQRVNSKFSIIISDENNNVLGESLFPANTYDFLNINVMRNGLLISKENPENPQNKEDLYEFDLIKFNL